MTTKKTPAKKTAVKKPATKKTTTPAKKTTAKTSVKSSTTKKTAAAKAPVKKTATTKPAAKKITITKKPAVKAAGKSPAKPTAKSAAKPNPAPKNPAMEAIKNMARAVEKALDVNKAKDVVSVDLTRKSALADFMIVASGNNSRQVAALARYAEEALLKAGSKRCKIEGLPQGDWVIVDSGDIIVHLFRPEVREFYQIERLWTDEPGEANSRRSLA